MYAYMDQFPMCIFHDSICMCGTVGDRSEWQHMYIYIIQIHKLLYVYIRSSQIPNATPPVCTVSTSVHINMYILQISVVT